MPQRNINTLFGDTIAHMVRVAPRADSTLGALRARNVFVPPGVLGREDLDLAAWIENDWQPPRGRTAPIPGEAPRRISLSANVSGIESGRCNYTRSFSGEAYADITEDRLMRLAAESADREDFMDRVREHLVSERSLDIDDYVTASYDDEESEDESIDDWDYSPMESAVAQWLDEHPECDPDIDHDEEEDDEEEEEVENTRTPF